MTAAVPQDDHRTRVGQERREKMRARLIEAATLVFAELGPEEAQIDHVIRQAGVSRGTFYNYFRSTEQVLHAAKNALAKEMVALVTAASALDAPAPQRLAEDLKAFIDLALRHPLLLDFIGRLGLRNLGSDGLVPALADADLSVVIDATVAEHLSPRMATDILKASSLALLLRLMDGETVDVSGFVAAMLRMFGHPAAEAERLAQRAFTPVVVPADSLIARSEAARNRAARAQ